VRLIIVSDYSKAKAAVKSIVLKVDRRKCGQGYSLVEVLVVIGVLGVLAGMMLPSLAKSKEKVRVTQCINNLKQIGTGMALYTHDNRDVYPPDFIRGAKGIYRPVSVAIGGRNPVPELKDEFLAEQDRPLYPYLSPSRVFQCAEDHGATVSFGQKQFALKPTSWEVSGCSYMYNVLQPYHRLALPFASPKNPTVGGHSTDWIADPSRYILIHEPPARGFITQEKGRTYNTFEHWHFASQTPIQCTRETWTGPDRWDCPQGWLAKDNYKFLSPIAFADTHVKTHDFTRNIRNNPTYPYEATADWTWYKAAPSEAVPVR
jgi:prepilin-type N-terminal cleavage/methylation domain-containing protein